MAKQDLTDMVAVPVISGTVLKKMPPPPANCFGAENLQYGPSPEKLYLLRSVADSTELSLPSAWEGGGESVSQSLLKNKAFLILLGQKPTI
jgi:hypothetical protein